METQLKSFHVETNGSLNFFTTAKNQKAALKYMIKNSQDFKNLIRKNENLTITVKLIPEKKRK